MKNSDFIAAIGCFIVAYIVTSLALSYWVKL